MTLTEVKNMATDVRKAVCDAFEEKAFENGIVTTQTLAEMFKEHHKKMDKLIATRLAAIQKAGGGLTAEATVNEDKNQEPKFAQGDFHGEPTTATTPAMYRTYINSDLFWHTPPGFCSTAQNEVGHWLEDLVPWHSMLPNNCNGP
jgi:hypothetical protein